MRASYTTPSLSWQTDLSLQTFSPTPRGCPTLQKIRQQSNSTIGKIIIQRYVNENVCTINYTSFVHHCIRILGTTTLAFVTYVFLKSLKAPLPPRAAKAATAMAVMAWMQVGLGITTLLTYVPTPIAAMHQAGALVTLSSALWFSHELKLMKVIKHIPK